MTSKFRNRLFILAISVIIMILLFVINMVRSNDAFLPSTPTPELTSTSKTGETEETATATVKATNTQTGTPDFDATSEVENVENTAIVEAQTATHQAAFISTAEAGLALATKRARSMSNIVKVLFLDGSVQSIDGSYKSGEDFGASYDRTGYYQMWYNEFEAKYFVLRANMLWNNAGEEVSYPLAGCGIVFGFQDLSNHHRVFLNLDGSVKTHRMQNDEFSILSIESYGTLEQPAGHANLILAVDEGLLSVYINNQLITRLEEDVLPGKLAYAIASGSSIGFGTSCEFKDIEMWVLE